MFLCFIKMLDSFLTIPQEYIDMKIDGYNEELYLKLVERDYNRLKERIKTGKKEQLVPLYHEMNEKRLLIKPHRDMTSAIKPNVLRGILIDNIWYSYSQRLCLFMFGTYAIVIRKYDNKVDDDNDDEDALI